MMTTLINRFVTDPHNMTKIYILIALLPQLFYTLVLGQESPCPENFQYITKPETNETTGLIEISLPPRTGVELQLNLTLEVAGNLPTGNTGLTLKFLGTSTDIPASKLSFHVDFPLHYPIPEIIGIWFNGERYCTGPNVTDNPTTVIMLLGGHLLLESKVKVNHTVLLPENLSPNLSQDLAQNLAHSLAQNLTSLIPNILAALQDVNSKQINTLVQNTLNRQSLPDPNQTASLTLTSIPTPISIPSPTSAKPTPQDNDDDDSINNNSECGINNFIDGPNLLIVNGNETSQARWPWLVALFHSGGKLYVSSKEEGYTFLCAGSVVSNKHIITAAHCLTSDPFGDDDIIYRRPDKLLVSLGRFNLTDKHEKGNINREVASYKIHPDYMHTLSGDSDLAILILKTPVEYNSFIKPICLWTGSTKLEKIVNKIGHVVGWGSDELGNRFTVKPKMVDVPIVSQADCLWSHHVFRHLTSNRTLCAGFRDHSGPCNGDSGSGLIIFDDFTERYRLRGVVSRSTMNNQKMCDLQKYIVYVDVAKYVSWIRQEILYTNERDTYD